MTPAGDHFFRPARRKERHVVALLQRMTTQQGGKMVPALRVAAEKTPLCVARRVFGLPNFSPRALIGAFSVTTGIIQFVLTGPKLRHAEIKNTRTCI
jgi:hypothetical protein